MGTPSPLLPPAPKRLRQSILASFTKTGGGQPTRVLIEVVDRGTRGAKHPVIKKY